MGRCYKFMCVSIIIGLHVCMGVCMYGGYVCMGGMYVCMCVCMYV